MTRFALIVAFLALPLVSHAESGALARYIVQRDSNGKLVSISLAKPHQTLDATPTLLDELRDEYDAENASTFAFHIDQDDDAPVPENAEDKKTYEGARDAVAHKIKRSDLDDPRLKSEFAKADAKLSQIGYFQLIAAPQNPEALDQGRETKRTIDGVALGVDLALPTPLFSIFHFLVNQQVEALESRRAFYQNQLLVILDSPEGRVFSDAEKNLIRSSIFYSRIDIMKSKSRRVARNAWTSFGTRAYRELQSECSKHVPHPVPELGSCFQNEDRQIKDYAVTKHRKSSAAFKYDKPYAVRDHRKFLMLTKLGAQFTPVPGFLKAAFCKWIDSHYVPQRRAEGYLHGSLLLAGKGDLAQWVIVNSANTKLY